MHRYQPSARLTAPLCVYGACWVVQGMAESAGVMVNYEYVTAAAGGDHELQVRQDAFLAQE